MPNGLAVHRVHPITGNLRVRPEEVCAASLVYRNKTLQRQMDAPPLACEIAMTDRVKNKKNDLRCAHN